MGHEHRRSDVTINFRELVDPDAGQVSARIYADEAIYDAEMDRIFGTAGCSSRMSPCFPKRGDYMTTTMGDDPVVVVNQR